MVTTGLPAIFRALIADDDDIVRRVLSRALAEEGFECERALDGEKAISLLLGKEQYDLLVTDLRMPGINGHTLSIEALKALPGLVVIVHTAVEEPRLAKDLIFRGVDDVIFKPTNYRAFAAKARGYVARRQQLEFQSLRTFGRQATPRSTVSGFGATSSVDEPWLPDDQSISVSEAQASLEMPGQPVPVPPLAADVYSMTTRDDCKTEELAAAIGRDASLTAEVLKLANSSHGGSPLNEIDSVEKAIVRLGRRSIGELALATVQGLRKKTTLISG